MKRPALEGGTLDYAACLFKSVPAFTMHLRMWTSTRLAHEAMHARKVLPPEFWEAYFTEQVYRANSESRGCEVVE